MIRNIEINTDNEGTITSLRILFGQHHFLELISVGKKTTFVVGATHHGFKADASTVPSELENFCEEIRRAHPKNAVD